jgi:hypothetical protein
MTVTAALDTCTFVGTNGTMKTSSSAIKPGTFVSPLLAVIGANTRVHLEWLAIYDLSGEH